MQIAVRITLLHFGRVLKAGGGRNIPTSGSTLTAPFIFATDIVYLTFKQHENKLSQLQRELMDLKQKLEFFEEDLGKTKWGVKYSRTFHEMTLKITT
jgi:hypothetical protein